MKDDETYRIGEYRDGTDSRGPCPRCGQMLPLNATSCHACGVNFRGQAGDFGPGAHEYKTRGYPVLRRIAAVLLIALVALVVIGFLITRLAGG
jgi:hypothetical protein